MILWTLGICRGMAEKAGLAEPKHDLHTPCIVADDLFVTKTYESLSGRDDGGLAMFSIRAYSSTPQDD